MTVRQTDAVCVVPNSSHKYVVVSNSSGVNYPCENITEVGVGAHTHTFVQSRRQREETETETDHCCCPIAGFFVSVLLRG